MDSKAMRLYAVTDRAWLKEGETLPQAVEKALKGGATFIQLREKTCTKEEFKVLALEIQALCKSYGVPFVINDDVALAKEIAADGVHVGQSDMEAGNVREILGDNKIIGVSAATLEEALKAERAGASYLGVGAVFHTDTKSNTRPVTPETIKSITSAVNIPVVAIGGIKKDKIHLLGGLGLDGVAVVSAIFANDDIESATAELKSICNEVFGL